MTTPLSIGWNVPFNEAIQATVARKVVLPDLYYGSLQGIHRQLAFSIANVTSVDQLQAVLDSLTHSLKTGETFAQWQKNISVKDLGLPKYRLDNIFRTNIQSAYNRGHWEQQVTNKSTRPYLMYDAINDSRTRPSHLAMNGIIRPIGDPFWSTHYPPNGYRSILPNQRVSGNTLLGLKAFYSGKAVEIIGQSGGRFSVTAQHPILTARGWVMSDEIKIGDQLVCYSSEICNSSPSAYLDKDNLPPTIEKVFDTLRTYIRTTAPRAAMNLHGNVQFINGDVEIVGMDRKLMDSIDSTTQQLIHQFNLSFTNKSITKASSNSPLMRIFSAATFNSRFRSLCRPLLDSLLSINSKAFFATRHKNSTLTQKISNIFGTFVQFSGDAFGTHTTQVHINDAFWHWLSNFRARNAQFFSTADFSAFLHGSFDTSITDIFIGSFDVNPDALSAVIKTHPSKIKFDEVIDSRLFDYSGHVYDLETKSGHILAYGGECNNHYVLSNCRCRCISLNERQAIERSNPDNNGNPQGIYKGINPETMKPDTGWDYNVGEDLMTGIDRAIAERMTAGKVNAPLVEQFKEQQAKQPTDIIDKQAFSSWVDTVSQPDYKARHEFMRVGILPDAVMADSEVFALKPVGNEIFVSDYQLKHSQRPEKSVPLPIEILKQLPEKLESSRWFFDASHNNLIAAFDIQASTDIGKAVLQINFYKKKKEVVNAIVTSGLIDSSTLLMTIYREIFDNKP